MDIPDLQAIHADGFWGMYPRWYVDKPFVVHLQPLILVSPFEVCKVRSLLQPFTFEMIFFFFSLVIVNLIIKQFKFWRASQSNPVMQELLEPCERQCLVVLDKPQPGQAADRTVLPLWFVANL